MKWTKSAASRSTWGGAILLVAIVFCVPGDARQASPPAAQGAPQRDTGQQPRSAPAEQESAEHRQ